MLDTPGRGPESMPRAADPNEHRAAQTWKQKLTGSAKRFWERRYRVLAAIIAACFLWYFGTPILFGTVVTVDPVVRRDFVQSLVASGHVETPFRVNIGSQITGVVADVPVNEGQAVKAGDVLVLLDDREARAAVVQMEGVVAQAEARMRQLREFTLPTAEETLRQAQATLVNAEAVYERTAKLAKEGVATKASLDDATRARDVARAQANSAELQVFTSRPGGSDYVMAETLLNQARANLATVQSRLSYTVIKAPRDGTLISRNVERGNVVQPSTVMMMLSPALETQIVVLIDEKNLGLVQIGQSVIASADAFPKETFAAEVSYINPGVDLQRAAVQVKLRVPNPPSYLRQDMTVSVDIETARRRAALIVPLADVRGIGTPNTWVLAVNSGRAVNRPVSVGLVAVGKAEILQGLKEGDLIIPATAGVREGARVRARPAAQRSP